MENKTLLIVAAAGLLLMSSRRASAATATPRDIGAVGTITTAGPTRNYFDPVALAAQFANRVISSWGQVAPQTLPGATANPESARNAVRSMDNYYGGAALDWTAGNVEAAREAVRAGDTYYTTPGPVLLERLASQWTTDNSATAY